MIDLERIRGAAAVAEDFGRTCEAAAWREVAAEIERLQRELATRETELSHAALTSQTLQRELAALQDWAHTESLNTVRLNRELAEAHVRWAACERLANARTAEVEALSCELTEAQTAAEVRAALLDSYVLGGWVDAERLARELAEARLAAKSRTCLVHVDQPGWYSITFEEFGAPAVQRVS
jgi:predicted  nucleic acid-binding Zn-ribbon protein